METSTNQKQLETIMKCVQPMASQFLNMKAVIFTFIFLKLVVQNSG